MGDRRGRRVVGRRPEDREKACRHGYYHRRASSPHTDASCSPRRSARRTGLWLSAAGQGRRRHQGQRRAVGAALPQPRRSPSRRDLTDRAEMDSAVTELARQTLTEIVAAGARSSPGWRSPCAPTTFYTRTKIRKLAAPSTDADVDHRGRAAMFSTCSNSTGRSGCWACGWNWRCRTPIATAVRRGTRRLRVGRLAGGSRHQAGEDHVDLAHRDAVRPPRNPLEHVQRADVGRRVDQEPVLGDPGQDLVGRHSPASPRGRVNRSIHRLTSRIVAVDAGDLDCLAPAAFSPRRAPPPTPRCGGGPGRTAAPPTARAARTCWRCRRHATAARPGRRPTTR